MKLEKLMDWTLVGVKFDGQALVDRCGSSSVLIALELIRVYEDSKTVPRLFQPPAELCNVVRKRLHKVGGDKLKRTKASHLCRKRTYCNYCPFSVPGNDRRKIRRHEEECKKGTGLFE